MGRPRSVDRHHTRGPLAHHISSSRSRRCAAARRQRDEQRAAQVAGRSSGLVMGRTLAVLGAACDRRGRPVTRWAAFGELRRGVGVAVRQPRLIAALWLWQLVVALAGTLPVFQWLRDTTALRPAADRLLVRFSLPDVVDAVRTTQ